MKKLKALVTKLSPEKLAVFRKWFYEFDNRLWDKQFERDVKAGKFDRIVEKLRHI
jgi:hypothetical protein